MNYDELFQQAMSGNADALETLCEMAGSGDEEAQYVLSCVYNNIDSPFRDVDLGIHWLKTSAGYGYIPAMKKMNELSIDIKRQYGLVKEADNATETAKTSSAASDSIWSFEGRIDRTTYLSRYIVYTLIFAPIIFLAKGLSLDGDAPLWIVVEHTVRIVGLFLVAALWVKRLHDCGRSGWWALLVPITQFVILFWPGENKDNEYGPKIE